jgi:hypothetical protein
MDPRRLEQVDTRAIPSTGVAAGACHIVPMPRDVVATAVWRRLDVPGHDAAQVTACDDGWRLAGAAVFRGKSGPVALGYEVICGPDWATRVGIVRGFAGRAAVDWRIARDAGGWTLNGVAVPGLGHCRDLDFGFTPATNFTQTRRIALAVGATAEVPVAWIDADDEALAEVAALVELQQTYVKRSEHACWYESSTTSYRALLELAPDGFVARYPELWEAEGGA